MKEKYFKVKTGIPEDITYFNYRNNEFGNFSNIPIHIESVGKTFKDMQYLIKRSNWDLFTIEFVVSGEGFLIDDGIYYHVKKGDLYILREYSVQEYGSSKENPYEKIWINFRSAYFPDLLKMFNLQDVHVLSFPEGNYYLNQLYGLKNTYHCIEDAAYAALNIIFNLLSHISQNMREQNDNIPPLIRKAAEYIDSKIMEPIKINEISEYVGISTTSLINQFKKYYKKTPYDYQLNNRLKTAQLYIGTTDKSLSEIAEICGFYDAFSLSKAFKKKFGVSPREIKKEAAIK